MGNGEEISAENKGLNEVADKNIEIALEKQQGRLNKILESLAKMETNKEKETEKKEELIISNRIHIHINFRYIDRDIH